MWHALRMGIFKDAKATSIGIDAKKARDAGRSVFTPLLNLPGSQAGISSGIDDWAVMVEAIEAEGWTLAHWSVGLDAKGRAQAYPLFRRA